MDTIYKSNIEPQVGDKVKFTSDAGTVATHEVTSVGGGRLGNKVGVKPIGQDTFAREYYYHCLTPVKA